MKLTGKILTALTFISLTGVPCFAGSITYSDQIQISGVLKLVDSPICFADNTCMTTAVFSDGSSIWGQITGYIDDQLDLSVKFATKEDKIDKGAAGGYAPLDMLGRVPVANLPRSFYDFQNISVAGVTPVIHSQGPTWTTLDTFSINHQKDLATALTRIEYTDNIGTAGAAWCNLGVFMDDEVTPRCFGSWSGITGQYLFNQQSLNCVVSDLPIGVHVWTVKHRSQNCIYGNYAFDEYGANRQLTISEVY